MHITIDKAVDGFIGFMADNVSSIQKMGDRFLGFAALGALKNNPAVLVNKVKPWLEMAGIVSNGEVNVDLLRLALDEAFRNVPKISYFGFTFTSDDAAALVAKMQGSEVVQ
jgi:hypothetical protein